MAQSVKLALSRAFQYLLKPLVRLSIRNGLSFAEFSLALKNAYVEVASSQIGKAGKELTEEGIAVLTGIPAAEVRDLSSADDSASRLPITAAATHPLALLLSAWHTDPRYTGPYGVLRDLPLDSLSREVTFSSLVDTYSPGLDPRAILSELIASGCVQKLGDDYYRAVKRTYVHEPLSEESIRFMARTIHNLCESFEVNQRQESAGGKGLMQRTIYTRFGLSKKDLADFNSYVRVRGQTFADDIDNWLTEWDVEGASGAVRTGIGFYHYTVTEDDETSLLKQSVN